MKILTDLCRLYGLTQIKIDPKVCYQTGYFDRGLQINDFLIEAIKVLLKEIRPQAVNVVESMKVPDFYLQSAIGNSNGDIYETHFE